MAMAIPVKLDDIIQELECQSDEHTSYLYKKTGEVVTVGYEELRAAESDEPIENLPEWEQENIKTAQEILETEDYVPLPSKFDIHEYSIMERFCLSIADDKLRDTMYRSIKGSGAFRRFKDNIRRYNIEEDWYKYQYEALKQIAIEWCEENDIDFIPK